MTPASPASEWRQLESIYYAALELPLEERSSFLVHACTGDLRLKEQVEALLASDAVTDGFLHQPVLEEARKMRPVRLPAGDCLGSYRILDVLGEGGMGTVYLAARADDLYRRQVAIKVVRAGFAADSTLFHRFSSERQILAKLDHPNIARLFDGGVTETGMPYLVMEFIDGVTIDRYCREHSLDVAERLALFSAVCSAVDYAHKNLVVHRDLKPANILVTAEGIPKLLDFGIAKLLDEDCSGVRATRTIDRVMTPEYASPEQVLGQPVTTSTDVYALGVLLYELMVGERPFRFETTSPLEAARIICETPPGLPSERLLSHARKMSAGDSAPSGFPRDARRRLAGDIDNIILMAMRKEPTRRYLSANALSSDINAYLKGFPVQARTDTWRYRSAKFIARHKAGVVSAMVVFLALLGFSVAMGALARRALRERRTAQTETQFLASIFLAATPDEDKGKEVTAHALLDQASSRIHQELKDEPQIRATLLNDLGYAYQRLGHYTQAENQLREAYDLRSRSGEGGSLEFANTELLLATSLRLEGRNKEAEPLFRDALSIRRARIKEESNEVAESLAALGECLYYEERIDESVAVLEQALRINRSLDSNSGESTRNYLALALEAKGDYRQAAALLREALVINARIEGANTPDYANSLHNLAGAEIDSGDLNAAESTEREDLALRLMILPKDHPDIAYSYNNLGWILLEKGNWQAAEYPLKENLRICESQLAPDNPRTISALNNLGHWFEEKGDLNEAERYLKRALEAFQKVTGPESLSDAKVLANLARVKLNRGDYAQAERYDRDALAMRRKLTGDSNPAVASSLIDLALARDLAGDPASAVDLLRQAKAIRSHTYAAGHPALIEAAVRLGQILLDANQPGQADPILHQASDWAHHSPFPLQSWQVAETDLLLGRCLLAEGNPAGQRLVRLSKPLLVSHPVAALRRKDESDKALAPRQ